MEISPINRLKRLIEGAEEKTHELEDKTIEITQSE